MKWIKAQKETEENLKIGDYIFLDELDKYNTECKICGSLTYTGCICKNEAE